MQIPTISYLSSDGCLSDDCTVQISKDLLVKGYKTMVLARLVDKRMITLQRQGEITFAMSALGEEACSVASAAALDIADWMYPQYRESGILFYRGYTIKEYVHHMFCNAQDSVLGRQMPNHFGSRKLNVVTVSSPIATKIPHAAGCAYAMKLQKQASVAICYFGEGATSEGDFHTGVNFAAVRKAPVIFFCRNNGYAISTPTREQFAADGIASKGIGYGIETMRVDGNDYFAIYDAVNRAKEHCLNGLGPVLIEAMTYRLGAHSTSDDPSGYRQKEEEEEMQLLCPIKRLRKYLEERRLWNEEHESEWSRQVEEEITEAIKAAKDQPPPSLLSLIEDVYFTPPRTLKEQLTEIMRGGHA